MPSDPAPPVKDISKWTLGLLLALVLAKELAWAVENQYFNTFLYNVISPNPLAVSVMVAVTAIVSTMTAILMGTLSDRTRGRWGKRKPFIVIGYIAWGIFTALFPTSAMFHSVGMGIFMAILYDSLMTFFGATASDAALSAYITDITTVANRGKVMGQVQIMIWVAMLIVYGGAGLIIDRFGYYVFFYVIGGIVLLAGALLGPRLQEPPDTSVPQGTYWEDIRGTFRWKNLTENKTLLQLLIAITLFAVAFNVFFPYIIIYMQHYLNLGIIESSLSLAITILFGGIVAAYPLGLLVDRWGRMPVAALAVVLECAGLIVFSFAKSLPVMILTALLFLTPFTAWQVATMTWTRDLFPEDKRGQFSGYFILFSVLLAMVPGPLLGGWLANTYGIPAIINGQPGMIPTPILFQVAGVMMLLALIPLWMIRRTTSREGRTIRKQES